MRVTIDTDKKEIIIEDETVSMFDLINFLNAIMPNDSWKEYNLKPKHTVSTITIKEKKGLFEDFNPPVKPFTPYYPTFPNEPWRITCNTNETGRYLFKVDVTGLDCKTTENFIKDIRDRTTVTKIG